MNILNKIKSTSHIKDKSEEGKNESELEMREELEKEELKEANMRYTTDSLFEKQKFDN